MYSDYQAGGGARAHGSPGSGLDDDPPLDEPSWLIEAGRRATDQRRQH
jgi:hypothetical protein